MDPPPAAPQRARDALARYARALAALARRRGWDALPVDSLTPAERQALFSPTQLKLADASRAAPRWAAAAAPQGGEVADSFGLRPATK